MAIDYNLVEKKFYEESIEDFKSEWTDLKSKKWSEIEEANKIVSKKIESIYNKHYQLISKEDIWNDIRNSKLGMFEFIKDPKKQSVHEKFACDEIKKIEGITDFEKLSQNKTSSFVVEEGKVIPTRDKSTTNNTKSIDFKWTYYGKIVYATHKYTKEAGGAQDNQYNDVINFFKEATSGDKKEDIVFVAILEGAYYQKKDKTGLTKIEYLNQQFGTETIFATTLDKLEGMLKQVKDC